MRYLIVCLGILGMAFSWPQTLKIPEFFSKPAFKFKGPQVRVDVQVSPLGLEVNGDVELEILDSHRIRLKSSSGHLLIGLEKDEAIYGLTERIVADRRNSESWPKAIGGLDRRGEIVTMWVLPSFAVYAPFYISSRGYGMFIEGTQPGIYDIGKTDPDIIRLGWEVGSEGFSCVFIEGTYLEILDRYTSMTGRPVMPPKWVFSPWKWRDACVSREFATLDNIEMNADVVDDITNYERLGFPVGVYMIDRPWAEGTFGYGNFNWDENRFPNGDRMVKALHDRGWRVIIWGAPWALGKEDWEFGSEAKAKGLVIGDRCLDYTNPLTVAWHRDKIEAFLKRTGIDGWKLDRADEYNPSGKDDIYHDGRTGREVHNDYPRLYIKTYYDATRAVRGDDFVLKARPAYTGTTAWSIVWGGDITGAAMYGLFSTDKGLRSVIISLQRAAFMGYPVWGSDTGGYQRFKNREVFARWLELSAFCPLMEIGGVESHEPWAMPTKPAYDEEMIKIFYRYTWLHARLQDYTYELAKKAHETGDPIVHPLVFDWPNDEKVKDMWDEYLYGPGLLVAPVWQVGKRQREVYLPQGEWTDLWDQSKKYKGPTTVTADAPLNLIPVYIREEYSRLLPEGLTEGL